MQLSLEGGKFKLRGETMLSFLIEEGMEKLVWLTKINLFWV